MTIVVTGGGSGGHITPILAVAHSLKKLQPGVRIVYISQTGDPLEDIPAADQAIDEVYHVRAGKFRRYHGEGWKQLLDLETMLLNIRDAFWNIIGLWQSFWLLRRLKPSVIFTRGSFVSVPVCLAAALQHVPYVTHDSDAIPSLTNRMIAPWATTHAVALPEEIYPYPIDQTVTVGVPISEDYRPVDDKLRARYKEELHLEGYEWVLLATGGGLGAKAINDAVVSNASELLRRYPGLVIVHLTGRIHAEAVTAAYKAALTPELFSRVEVIDFVTDLYRYSGAANVVIARAGATNLAELAVQAKACIIVPSAFLTGGHQMKNTEALAKHGAVIQMTDEQIEQELRLASVVTDLFDHPGKVDQLQKQFAAFAKPDAAEHIARIVLGKACPARAETTEAV
jgi:UDP-N-acetylglucosamine--N-acetylmuramyl-(pentapeptide) pyrophosphoryl-undecaprenol N-acetylglucosamine transferase